MSVRGAWCAVVVGLVLLVALAVPAMWPVDATAYRGTAVMAAQDSLSAVRTTALVADARLKGQIFAGYTSVMVDDARTATATAQGELAGSEVPDATSARLRDDLAPLLSASAAAVGDAGTALSAGDDTALRAVLARLTRVGDDLQAFVEGHR
jgi:hypothetical protein